MAAMKAPSSTSCRRALKTMWAKVAVYSCADGTVKLEPVWKGKGLPGLLDRLHAAHLVERLLGVPVKKVNWVKRSSTTRAGK